MFGKLHMTDTKLKLKDVHVLMKTYSMRGKDMMQHLFMMYWSLKELVVHMKIVRIIEQMMK